MRIISNVSYSKQKKLFDKFNYKPFAFYFNQIFRKEFIKFFC